jgi:uncharacterized protein
MQRIESDRLSTLSRVLIAVVIVGGINWGLIGFFNWDLVAAIFGGTVRGNYSTLSRIVYALVGLCSVALMFLLPRYREVPSETTTTTTTTTHRGGRSEVRP